MCPVAARLPGCASSTTALNAGAARAEAAQGAVHCHVGRPADTMVSPPVTKAARHITVRRPAVIRRHTHTEKGIISAARGAGPARHGRDIITPKAQQWRYVQYWAALLAAAEPHFLDMDSHRAHGIDQDHGRISEDLSLAYNGTLPGPPVGVPPTVRAPLEI
jgi:hypothetical protein